MQPLYFKRCSNIVMGMNELSKQGIRYMARGAIYRIPSKKHKTEGRPLLRFTQHFRHYLLVKRILLKNGVIQNILECACYSKHRGRIFGIELNFFLSLKLSLIEQAI